ncbi:hypothetical protein C8Q80DRAFT_1122124 [Daedaleopsis nitida]|nr:hypothetical protein C8Q80DRAFT_1122124 [Daedaleopsis nitida]
MTKAKPRQAETSAVRHAAPTRISPVSVPPVRNAYAGLANEWHSTGHPSDMHGEHTIRLSSPGEEGGGPVDEPAKKSRTILRATQPPSARTQQFLYKWAARTKKHVLEREAGPMYPVRCKSCEQTLRRDSDDRVYRCCDCYDPAVQCVRCAVSSHRRNPFHHFAEWCPDQGFWGRISLGEISGPENLFLHLGHQGSPCPLNSGPVTRTLMVVHEHGVHKFGVRFCKCTDKATSEQTPAPVQLICFGLWPGSWERPETAFSITASGRPPGEQYLDVLFHTVDGNLQHTQKTKPMDMNDLPLTLSAAYYANERDFGTFQKLRLWDDKEKSTCNKFGAMGYSQYGGRVTGTVSLSCARHMFAMRMGAVDMDQGEAGLRPYIPLRLLVSGYDINCQYHIHFAERMKTIREKFAGLESIPKTTFPPMLIAIGKFHLPAHIPSCCFKFSYNFLPGIGMTDGEALEHIWSILDGLTSCMKEMGPGHRHGVTNNFYNDMNIRRTNNLGKLIISVRSRDPKPRRAAIELSSKLKRALLQRAESDKHFQNVQASFSHLENVRMAMEEQVWLSDMIHLDKHKDLKNPYELKIDRGLMTKELLGETAKAHSHERGGDPGLAVLDAVYEGVELQNLREELLDALEEGGMSDTCKEDLEEACTSFITRVAEWSLAYNTVLQPALEVAAQEVVRDDDLLSSPRRQHLHFPLQQEADIQPSITAKTSRAEKGLPRLRDTKDRCTSWQQVYDVVIMLPSSFDARVLDRPAVASLVSWEKHVREGCANAALNDVRTHIVTSEMLKIKKLDVSGKALSTRIGKRIQHKYSEVEAAAKDYRHARMALLVDPSNRLSLTD